jgi:hypothetical protein
VSREPFKDGYAAIAKVDGIGRNILEARLRAAAVELQTLFNNLTTTQKRGTELLEENRQLRAVLRLLADMRALDCSVSEPACGQCVRCRAKALIAG